jgi:hypothetical protein
MRPPHAALKYVVLNNMRQYFVADFMERVIGDANSVTPREVDSSAVVKYNGNVKVTVRYLRVE